jgi:hypothetical protein
MEAEAGLDEASLSLKNAKFWEHLQGIFEQTRQMLADKAKELGIDLEAAVHDEEIERELEETDEYVHNHPLHAHAWEYLNMVDAWFDRHEESFAAKGDELVQQAMLDLEGLDPEAEAIRLSDAVEVIRWYQTTITAKLDRALGGAYEDRQDPEADEDGFPRDSDGSAKVALLAIDRSLAAWSVMRDSFPDEADPLLDVLVHLDQLRRGIEREFPAARAFVRPGFDTTDS